MKKILIVGDTTSYIKEFHIEYIKKLKQKGYEIHIASNGKENIEYCDKQYKLDFSKDLFTVKNLKAYKNLKRIIKENEYRIIYCYTLIAGVLTRGVVRKAKTKTKVTYITDGFEFYKGAPIRKWLMYYPLEKYLSKYTDVLMTINKEDYNLARNKFKRPKIKLIKSTKLIDVLEFRSGEKRKISCSKSKKQKQDSDVNSTNGKNTRNGININNKTNKIKKSEFLKEFNLKENDYIFLSIGDLNKNQNQIMQLEAFIRIIKKYPNAKLLIEGEGGLKQYYEHIIQKYGLEKNVQLIGARESEEKIMLLKQCNCILSTSKKDDLPVNIIKAMIANKTILATRIRGYKDLLKDENLVDLKRVDELIEKMEFQIGDGSF